jgi:GAF domain-containing protein
VTGNRRGGFEGMKSYQEFMRERADLDEKVMDYADTVIKRLYSLDSIAWKDGALDSATKDLIALGASLALRCDDCVLYHLGRCAEAGVPGEKVIETLGISSLIGGSITIPHLRRAIAAWHGIMARIPREDFAALEAEAVASIRSGAPATEALQAVCDLLTSKVDRYDWVGFYLVDPSRERTLVLGPFSGKPTEHTRIEFGRGICGQAADTGRTFIIADVTAESNYLACSQDVRSEAVIPVWNSGSLVGELDIDSNKPEAFCNRDRAFLERVAALASVLVAEASGALSTPASKGGVG